MKCRNCSSSKFKKIVEIGSQPISSRTHHKIVKLKKYPLDLYECQNCKLVQLSKVAPSNEMYGSTYGYWTGLSTLMINHMKKKVKRIQKMQFIKNNSLILDIGSSDYTFLSLFKNFKKNLNLFAIDPSAKKFELGFKKRNINLIIDYFSKNKIEENENYKLNKIKKFSLISSFAMFYDINNPNKFCKDINNLLDKDGLWFVEFSYLPLLLKQLTYDQINHEHVTYYSLTTFKNILDKQGLRIIDVAFNDINGGSAEVIVAKKFSKRKSNKNKIDQILEDEKLINNQSYRNFNFRIENVKKVINLFLKNKSKKKIIGYGAATKGNIILNHCEITSKQIRYICDGNIRKHNRFTPGSNIKIISKEKMRKMKPDYLFVLLWSFRSEVIKQELKYINSGGTLIFPLPVFHIVDKENYKKFIKEDLQNFAYSY